MASVRSDPGYFVGVGLALFFGAVLLGGLPVFGQVLSGRPALLPPEENVVEVRVEGNVNVPNEKIFPNIRTRAGRSYNPELIEEDVRRLNKTGLFAKVKPYSQQVARGRLVVFEVYERPTVNYVKYVGNDRVSKKKLEKEADIKAGEALDTFAVEEARRRLQQFYHGQGFSKASVTIVEGNKASDRGVVFLINEGQKQRVLWTSFVGNTIASDARLRTQIKAKPGFLWVFKGEVDRKVIDEDINRLTAYYRSLGFYLARVGRELRFSEGQNWLTLTFVIDEGPRYTVRNVSFIGNTRFPAGELAAKMKLQEGEFFNQAAMQNDVVTLRDKYGGEGYVFADVNADLRFLEEPGQLDLVYNIREGQRCRVGKIVPTIQGDYPHTKITTIIDRMSVKPGDILDTRKLRADERRLQASGLFEVDPSKGSMPKIVFSPPKLEDIDVQVAERPKRPRGQSPDPAPQRPLPTSQPQPRKTPPVARPVTRGQYNSDAGRTVPALGAAGPYGPPAWPTPAPQGQNTAGAATYSGDPTYSGAPAASGGIPYGSPPPVSYPPPSGSYPPPPVSYVPPGPQLPPPARVFPNDGVAQSRPPYVDGLGSMLGNPPSQDRLLDTTLEPMVREARTGRLMFSVGVNSEAGLLGSIILDEQNFDITRFPGSWQELREGTAWRGAGQRFRVELVPGTQVQRYTINFQEPYLLHSPISLGVSGYFYNRWYREWSEERVGGRVALGYKFTPDLSGVFAYRGAKINISSIAPTPLPIEDLEEVRGDNALHGFQARLSHDTRDNAFLATQGHLFELTFEQVIGSFSYPRAEVDLRKYFMVRQRPDGSGRHVMSLNARFAVSGSDTPVYEHYYAGGFSSLRGFDFRGASPRNQGVPVGGECMVLASAEYMIPITADDAIRAVIFCDTGTVEPTISDWTDKYRVAPGFGLRITIPAMGPAPIALDFAFPISLESGDEVETFSFFVGFLR